MSMFRSAMICTKAKHRERRLCTESPVIKRHIRTISEAMSVLKPLSETKVTQPDLDLAFSILEKAAAVSESKETDIARYIANELVLGITEDTDIDMSKYNISDKSREIIGSAIHEAVICNRILNNQHVLEHRFNLDNVVRQNRYNPEKIISEICELIDTYDAPTDYKYNVALENILYSMVKNRIELPPDQEIVSKITEYFLMRDMTIDDISYGKYKTVLEGCTDVYDLHRSTPLIESVLNNNANYFKNRSETVLNSANDSYIKEYLAPKALSIQTEADAADYIDEVSAYIESCRDMDDEARLYYSVANIPNYSPVSKDFITIKRKETFDNDRFDTLANGDCITSDIEAITEKDPDPDSIFRLDVYRDLFREETYATSDDVEKLIAKFKAEQDKSPSKIKNFLARLHTKSPESIIDEVPDVFTFVRAGILLAIAASSPIGPILAGVTGLVSWLMSRKLNDKEATRLLNSIRAEKKKVKEKIDKASNEKKKKELEDYLDCLKNCESKVENYLDTLSDDDHSDPDGGDDDWDDFDFEDESAVMTISKVMEGASTEVEKMLTVPDSDILEQNILMGAKYNFLSDLGSIVRESSINMDDYIGALDSVKRSSTDPVVRTAINREISKCNESYNKMNGIRSIPTTMVSDQAFYDIHEQVVTEKFNLNTVKLILQNAKSKLKDLSTKEKSMWQSVDAAGSGMVKSIEKAMTSDRREAIIKGSIIPSFSKCIKGAIALAGIGIVFGPLNALISALAGLAVSKALNYKEKRLIYDEIDTELKVVEKEIEIAQNDGDMKKYRFLLNYQKKLSREHNRIKYGFKAVGRDIPSASIPGRK